MKVFKRIVMKYSAAISALAVTMTTLLDAGGACWFVFYQPEVPEEVMAKRRI